MTKTKNCLQLYADLSVLLALKYIKEREQMEDSREFIKKLRVLECATQHQLEEAVGRELTGLYNKCNWAMTLDECDAGNLCEWLTDEVANQRGDYNEESL